jgi:hypothetical protein
MALGLTFRQQPDPSGASRTKAPLPTVVLHPRHPKRSVLTFASSCSRSRANAVATVRTHSRGLAEAATFGLW